MPAACHAKGCKHQTKDNFRLFKFPANQERREIWRKNCGRENAPQYARLCEYHFDDSQFEQNRQDGWRKLKPNAVPTIFQHYSSTFNQINALFNAEMQISTEETEVSEVSNSENDGIHLNLPNELNMNAIKSEITEQPLYSIHQSNIIKHLQMQMRQLATKNERLKKENHLLRIDNEHYKKQLLVKSKNLKLLRNIMDKIPVLKQFLEGFNHITRKWSAECLKFALQIRYAVGWKSYIYLQKKLGIPLPSYSTMCRHRNQINFTPNISKDRVSFKITKKRRKPLTNKDRNEEEKKIFSTSESAERCPINF